MELQEKEEFLAVLAHELRNPLAPLQNALQIVRRRMPSTDETLTRLTDMMERQIGHLVRLIDDLLDLSRITHGRLELRREPVLLRAIVDMAMEISRPSIDVHGHELTVHCRDERLAVDGDLQRLGQALCNLLSNSAKYTPHGGRITLTTERVGEDAVISVTDTGIGISPESLPSVFEMFFQGDARVEQSEGGLGIGLALVRRVVHLHGGTVTAHSDGVGTGSRFTVLLPALPPLERGVDTPDVASSSEKKYVVPLRILVADDDEDAAESLALWLQLDSHEVRTVADGEQVVTAAEQFRPQVIFMDLGMPRLDGLAASRMIRSRPWGRSIRIIALTGWGRAQDKRLSEAAGIDLHWVKPVDPRALTSVLAAEASTHFAVVPACSSR